MRPSTCRPESEVHAQKLSLGRSFGHHGRTRGDARHPREGVAKDLSKSLQRPPTRPSWPGGLAARSLRTAGAMGCADIYRHVLEAWSSLMTTRGKGRSPHGWANERPRSPKQSRIMGLRFATPSGTVRVLMIENESTGHAQWGLRSGDRGRRRPLGQDGRLSDLCSLPYRRICPIVLNSYVSLRVRASAAPRVSSEKRIHYCWPEARNSRSWCGPRDWGIRGAD